MTTAIYKLGRGLQVVGMIVVPIGMAGNIVRPEHITVQDSLTVAAVGVAIFVAGWLLQQFSRPQ